MTGVRLTSALASFAAIFAFGWFVKWMVEEYPQFGLGFCCGGLVMIVLYYIAERTGVRETHY